jgi:hypothetical protein
LNRKTIKGQLLRLNKVYCQKYAMITKALISFILLITLEYVINT